MSRTKSIVIIMAFILIIGGGLGFAVIMNRTGWDVGKLDSVPMTMNTVPVTEPFDSIGIVCRTEDVTLVPSADGTCRVEFIEWEKVKHTAAVEGNKLVIGFTDTRSKLEQFGFYINGPKINVYLPQKEYAELSIEGTTGKIDIPAGFTFGTVTVKMSTGDVYLFSGCTGKAHIETTTGSIRIEGVTLGDAELAASTGGIEVKNTVCTGAISARVTTGDTSFTDVTAKSLSSTGGTGDIILRNVIAEGLLSVERSTGDVRMEKCDAAEINIQTGTGDVSGSLLSDKVFIANSGTGRVSVPETVTGGKCKITSNTGNIRITVGGKE